MSLLPLTASATHTATTHVTRNNAVIIFTFLYKLSCLCLLTVQRYGCLRAQTRNNIKMDEKKWFH